MTKITNSHQPLEYYAEFFKPYFNVRTFEKKVTEEDFAPGIESPEHHPGLLKLSKAWNRLFLSGEYADIDIFARDEEKIAAHSLVLHVRCPKMIKLGIYENEKQIISCPEVSAYVLRSFLKLLYTGKLVGLAIYHFSN